MTGIPLSINVIIVIASFLAGWLEGKRLYAKQSDKTIEYILKKSFHLYILITLVLILFLANIILQHHRHIMWGFPVWFNFYLSATIWGIILTIFSFIFSIILTLSFLALHKDRWKAVVCAIVFVSAIQSVQWIYTKPIAEKLYEKTTPGGIVLQSSGSSCAAASAANILKEFNIHKTEQEMAELFGTTLTTGTSDAQIVYGMKKIGFKCRKVYIEDVDTEKLHTPAMLFIDYLEDEDHAIAILEHYKDGVEIIDPLIGKRKITREKFKKIWHGRAIEFYLDDGHKDATI